MNTLAQLKAGQLAGIQRLDLSCGLTEFPREIFELADSLEILNLSGNALSSLPDDLHRLPHLRVLFCSDNAFTELPACLGQCAKLSMIGFKANRIRHVPAAALPPLLRWLILTDNRISQLPDELGQRPLLQKLMLAGNHLAHLPPSLANCHNLELIRIASNRLTGLPHWLLALPSLTWLAYAGNPVEMAVDVADDDATPDIPWSALELAEVLGEGASGVIRKALWQPSAKPVAVKLYKGSITSDGSPLHEMQACIAAGLHPNLIKVEGRVVGHPDDQAALVMDLIEPSYPTSPPCRAWRPAPATSTNRPPASASPWHCAWHAASPRWPRTCTATASPMATCTATIFCGTRRATACSGISARRRSMPRRTPWKPGRCNALKYGRSGCCSGSCWSGLTRA